MSNTDLWDRAAAAMDKDSDPRWKAVGQWLRCESVCQQHMEPLTDLINVAIETQGGPAAYLRFGRQEDGNIRFEADTNEGATAVALAYLEPASSAVPAARGAENEDGDRA